MNSRMVSVSVIVPVYNVELYIDKCLDSLVRQTLETIEIIIVNDGSLDGSADIAKSYLKQYPDKIRYFEKENGGLSDARNYGMQCATGKYIAFLDSDDYVDINIYKLMYEEAERTSNQIVECNLYKAYPQKLELNYRVGYSSKKDYLLNGRVAAWNKLYLVSWLQELNAQFPKGLLYEDIEFFYKIVPYMTTEVSVITEPLLYYVQREGSILSKSTEKILQVHTIFSDIYEYYRAKGLYEEYHSVLEYKYISTLFCSFLVRMLRMKTDKDLRKKLVMMSWVTVNECCPTWRKNQYLKKVTPKNIYMRLLNRPLLNIILLF